MLLFLMIVGCGGAPDEVALEACELVPGIAMDPSGATQLAQLLTTKEATALSSAEPTLGLKKVGAAGVVEIREASSCTLVSTDRAGAGRWAVSLTRNQPLVKADGSIGALHEVALDYQVVKTPDGLRVEVGIPKALNARQSALDAEELGDIKRAASTWKSTLKSFGDPLLGVDVGRVQALSDVEWVRKQLMLKFDRVDQAPKDSPEGTPNKAVAMLVNTSKKNLAEAEVLFLFSVDGAEEVLKGKVGALAKGDKAEVSVDIPAKAEGSVKLDLGALLLAQ